MDNINGIFPHITNWTTTLEEWAIRMIDIAITSLGLILSLPIIALIVLIIKIDSPGPAIFEQKRIGKNLRNNDYSQSRNGKMPWPERRKVDLGGRPFTFYKFRTMYADAKERYPGLYRYQYSPEDIKTLYFKIQDDPRLTRFGRHLRKTTFDELPNLINVIKGDMSLVGPRPDIPEMIKYYEPWQRRKFQVKPGVTGLAQINGRGLLSFQETLKLDVEYVKKNGLRTNFKIILKTLWVTLLRIGAF